MLHVSIKEWVKRRLVTDKRLGNDSSQANFVPDKFGFSKISKQFMEDRGI